MRSAYGLSADPAAVAGSPLYARVYITGGTPYWLNTPIGIVDHENGYFALVSAAEWVLNVTAYR